MLNYTFIDLKVVFKVKSLEENLYLIGSFTNWLILEEFRMEKIGEEFVLEKNFEELNKIGNSGYIEYFFGNEYGKLKFDLSYPKGYYFNNQANKDFNYLLLPLDINKNQLEEIISNNEKSFIIKNKPEDFKDYEEFTNFRRINGGQIDRNILFRSYHPVIPSRADNDELKDIEFTRQQVLLDLLEKFGINIIINLSETEVKLKEYMNNMSFNYYKKLYLDNKVYSVPMSYETVYFMSSENISFNSGELGFQDGINKIIKIISENKGPYLVHCRLGSDRTGVVSAFLQLLMGATKEEIKENYLKTNSLGIGEFRSFNLLEFSLKKAFGENVFNNRDCVLNYLMNIGLKKEEIKRAVENLKCK